MADENAHKVAFELLTPTGLVEADTADMVVVPAAEGDIGVLPGHSPFLGTLRPGVLDIHDGGTVTQSVFVAGGFVEVTATACTVLADQAVPVADIDAAEAERRLAAAREALEVADDDGKSAAEAELRAAEAMNAAAGGAAE